MGRVCLFCSETANSREHVFFPSWAVERAKAEGRPIEIVWHGRKRFKGDIKVKAVCNGCNNAWMSDIDNRARPFFVDLPRGATSITPVDAYTLAQWATKTAMIYEHLATKGQPYQVFSSIDRADFKLGSERTTISGAPVSGMQLYLGRYDGRLTGSILGQPIKLQRGEESHRAYVVTLALFGVVLQAMFPSREVRDPETIWPRELWPGLLTQIWPTVESSPWPPQFAVSDEGITLDALSDRWRTK